MEYKKCCNICSIQLNEENKAKRTQKCKECNSKIQSELNKKYRERIKAQKIVMTDEELKIKKEKIRLFNDREDVKTKRETKNNTKILCLNCNHHFGYTHKTDHLKWCEYFKKQNIKDNKILLIEKSINDLRDNIRKHCDEEIRKIKLEYG